MELVELFKDLELTNERSVKKAFEAFSSEYHLLNGVPRSRQIDYGIFADSLTNSAMNYIINSISGFAFKNISGRLPRKSSSILEKISQMMQAEDATVFNKVKDYARIAAHVYGNRRNTILPTAWKCLGSSYQGLKLDDEESGLVASLYKKDGARPKYVYAFSGTKWYDIKDWEANIHQIAGISEQYERAGEISEKLAHLLGAENLIMTGHSKGGGQAAYGAMRTGCRAITFNPAGLGMTKFKHVKYKQADINSYVLLFDPLNLMQMLAQLYYADLTADGTVHYLKCDKNSPVKEWHGIDGFLRLAGMKDMHRIA